MTIAPENQSRFSQHCALRAKNVQNGEGLARFDCMDLQAASGAVSNNNDGLVPESVAKLMRNIIDVCNKQKGPQELDTQDRRILMLALLNIHAAFLMLVKI